MPNPTSVRYGGVFSVSTVPTVVKLLDISGGRRGSLFNAGSVRVYVGYQATDVVTDNSAGANYGWLDPDATLRLPKKCSKMCLKTASDTSVVLYVED